MNQEILTELNNDTFENNSHMCNAGYISVGEYFMNVGGVCPFLLVCTKKTDYYVHYRYVEFNRNVEPLFNDKIEKYKYYYFVNGKVNVPLHNNTFRVKNSTTIIAPNTNEIIWKKKY